MDIRDLSFEELKTFMIKNNLPVFRAKQIFGWLYKKNILSFYDMKNLPAELIKMISLNFSFDIPAEKGFCRSDIDGTEKYLLELNDKVRIETVALFDKGRLTICLSSQAGCPCGCTFCSTGEIGFIRNLNPSEIIGQFVHAGASKGRKPDNAVFMGMGEPMLNYDNVVKTIEILSHPEGLGFSQTRFTISTVGIVPGIIKLADSGLNCYLAVSLVTSDEDERKQMVPMAGKYSLKEIINAASYFFEKTGREVTFEYILMAGKTDTEERAEKLVKLISGIKAMVNIIPYNEAGKHMELSGLETKGLLFQKKLKSAGIKAFFRKEKGDDIKAACGQLAAGYNKHEFKTP